MRRGTVCDRGGGGAGRGDAVGAEGELDPLLEILIEQGVITREQGVAVEAERARRAAAAREAARQRSAARRSRPVGQGGRRRSPARSSGSPRGRAPGLRRLDDGEVEVGLVQPHRLQGRPEAAVRVVLHRQPVHQRPASPVPPARPDRDLHRRHRLDGRGLPGPQRRPPGPGLGQPVRGRGLHHEAHRHRGGVRGPPGDEPGWTSPAGKFSPTKKWSVTDMQWDDDVTVEGAHAGALLRPPEGRRVPVPPRGERERRRRLHVRRPGLRGFRLGLARDVHASGPATTTGSGLSWWPTRPWKGICTATG